jgi:hypothetical protein
MFAILFARRGDGIRKLFEGDPVAIGIFVTVLLVVIGIAVIRAVRNNQAANASSEKRRRRRDEDYDDEDDDRDTRKKRRRHDDY